MAPKDSSINDDHNYFVTNALFIVLKIYGYINPFTGK